ncbi:MAG: lycopene beta-cyclase CrtY [Immundisolibacter sp.]|uniref:lycopene beta-cyclase CrtY n=1 Tax=Immundisolibacter sp. TaxID=1934948 RepID=UPI0019B57027|nr:lycopene beta-cyclase CrtY [Immundisolibacter sp.]MBC7160751.1 lycopene beta-cyclase CrtY [Immundisolibacter sp.]
MTSTDTAPAPRCAAEPMQYDVVIAGAGLHGGLIALALLDAEPTLRLALVERADRPAGNHTWCFHRADVPPDIGSWFVRLPLIGWPGYRVAFPGFERTLDLPYCCLTSAALATALQDAFAAQATACLLTGCAVTALDGHSVTLADGRRLRAPLVIDARAGAGRGEGGGYQKFLGLEVELDADSGLDRPVLMDARVAQGQQFRFMYVLPLAPRRLLIEDTAFARTPELDPAQRRAAIHAYAAASGWRIRAVVREESGLLPMPWRGMPPAPRMPLTVGYAGGWFHPATGYSASSALRLAALLARHRRQPLAALQAEWRRHRRRFRLGLVLNWLAFRGFRPDLMWHPFARFYRLPLPVIGRFCSLQSTALDVARLLVGRPPRGFGSAWRAGQHTSEAGS